MSSIDQYIHAATRANTRKAYQGAVRHFEDEWGGFLPATADSVARYLVDHAQSHSLNTLRQRLAALAAWHLEQGFPDPTKAPHVRKVLKGIAELHPRIEKRARPMQLEQLSAVVAHLDTDIARHSPGGRALQPLRNKALMLVGFWRAFRSDELARLDVAHIHAEPRVGMEIFLPRSKGDRTSQGRQYKAPALKQLCPVEAYLDWIEAAQIKRGPVFRVINRWGHLADEGLHPSSIIGIIKACCDKAGLTDSESFTSHSLRRGFASWANQHRCDTKSLMEYVGWRDVASAMRYIDALDPFAHLRPDADPPRHALATATTYTVELEVSLRLERYNSQVRSLKKVRELIERLCFANWAMVKRNDEGTRYNITVTHEGPEHLDEILDDLLQQMHSLANDHRCILETTIFDPDSGTTWD